MAELLRFTGVSHRYGEVTALRGVDLVLQEGEVAGLLGPNGAGKSTLTRLAVGLEKAGKGEVVVFGRPVPAEARAVRREIGYMLQSPTLFEDLTALENVVFFGRAFWSGPGDIAGRAEELLEILGLGPVAGRTVGGFSGGMKQRVSLAAALVHRPRLLILDEPTAGMDPLVAERLWEEIGRLAAEGVGVLVSTHLLEEVHRVDRVIVLREGMVLAEETPGELLGRVAVSLRLTVGGTVRTAELADLPRELPERLREYGLDPRVTSIELRFPNVQEALLRVYGEGSRRE